MGHSIGVIHQKRHSNIEAYRRMHSWECITLQGQHHCKSEVLIIIFRTIINQGSNQLQLIFIQILDLGD